VVWLKFTVCVAIILIAGSRTARYADAIAEKTGLGRVWVGALVLAVVTSLPELVTSTSAATAVGDANLALGTLVGTCIFNLLILVLLDGLQPGRPVLSKVSDRHVTSAAMGAIIAGVVALGIFLSFKYSFLNTEVVGVPSVIVFIVYLFMAWRLSRRERYSEMGKSGTTFSQLYGLIREKQLLLKLLISSLAIIGAGIWLSFVGEELAQVTGWGSTFVGSLFLAITTSLPEITVAVAALRMGAVDLALADIMGANMLDLSYVFIVDLFYKGKSLLAEVSLGNLIMLSLLVVMNAVVILGLKFPRQKKVFIYLSWYSPLIILLYIISAFILFQSA